MVDSDIEFRHSGGASNSDPNGDLGGTMSSFQLPTSSINNLFSDLTPGRTLGGYIDFRCFYITNRNLSETLISTTVWIDSQAVGGSDVTLGFQLAEDQQSVIITTDNSMPVFHDASLMILQAADYGPPFTVLADDDPAAMAADFQEVIREIKGLDAVTVTASGTWPDVTFLVTFVNQKRYQPLFTLIQNNLGNGAVVNIVKVRDGSPINTTSPVVALEINTPPAAISFTSPLIGSPVALGGLLPTDYFPVWVRRETAAETLSLGNDGFGLGLDGSHT